VIKSVVLISIPQQLSEHNPIKTMYLVPVNFAAAAFSAGAVAFSATAAAAAAAATAAAFNKNIFLSLFQ